MTEQSTIDFINKASGTRLVLCKDEFSSYDAYDENYIVEVKNRRKYYRDKMIEAMKLFSNYQKAQISGKHFLYVVTDDNGVWVYNITTNIETILKSTLIALSCPMSTDFSSKSKIIKYSYALPECMAKKLM